MLGSMPEPAPQRDEPGAPVPSSWFRASESDSQGPILIVSRSRRLLAKIKGPLGREGYKVCRAEGVEDAISICSMLSGPLRLVIVDWMDPKLEADRLLHELHRAAPDLPLVLMEEGRIYAQALSGLRDTVLAGFLRDLATE